MKKTEKTEKDRRKVRKELVKKHYELNGGNNK